MYAVQFKNSGTDGLLYGQFATAQIASWWAFHESDGKPFTVHLMERNS